MADWLGSPGLWRKRSAAVVRCDLADVKETTGEQSLPEEMRAAIRGDRERAQKKRRYEPATTEAPTRSGAITETYPSARAAWTASPTAVAHRRTRSWWRLAGVLKH